MGGQLIDMPKGGQESVPEFEGRSGGFASNTEFARGVARGTAQLAGSSLDFLRVFSDSPRLKRIADELNETAGAIPTKAGSIMDVVRSPTLAPAYVARVVGELAPQAVAAYLSGGAATVAGRAAGLGKAGLRVAAGVGAAATSIPQEVGDIARETEDRTGQIDSGAALTYGIPSGLLDAVSAERILGKVFRTTEKEAQKKAWRAIVRDTIKEVPKTAGVEGATESVQEVLHIFADKSADDTFELLTKQNGLRVLESAVAGAIGGGFLGGGSEVASLGLQRAERGKRAEELKGTRFLRSRLNQFIRENPAPPSTDVQGASTVLPPPPIEDATAEIERQNAGTVVASADDVRRYADKKDLADAIEQVRQQIPVMQEAKAAAVTETPQSLQVKLDATRQQLDALTPPAATDLPDVKQAYLAQRFALANQVQALTEALVLAPKPIGGTDALPIQSPEKILIREAPINREAVVQGVPTPEEPAGTRSQETVRTSEAPVTPATVSGSSQFFVPSMNKGTRGVLNPAEAAPTLPGEAAFVTPDGSAVPAGTVFSVRYRTSGNKSGQGLRVYAGDKPIYEIDVTGTPSTQDGRKGISVDSAALMDLSKWKKVAKAPFVLPRDVKQKKVEKETEADGTGVIKEEAMGSKPGDVKPLAASAPSTFSPAPIETVVASTGNGDPLAHLDGVVAFLEDRPDLLRAIESGDTSQLPKVQEQIAEWLKKEYHRRAGERVITSEDQAALDGQIVQRAEAIIQDILEQQAGGNLLLSLVQSNRWRPDGQVTDTKVATGAQEIRAMLPEAGLNPEQLRLAQFLLDNVPTKYLTTLTLRIRSVLKNNQQRTIADGSFNSMLDIVEIARNSTNPEVLAHEMSHYLSQFLTSGYRARNFKLWQQAVAEFIQANSFLPPNVLEGFRNGMTTSEFRQVVMESVNSDFGPDMPKYLLQFYNLINPDEFFAKRFKDVVVERSQEVTWVAELMRAIIDIVKRLFGKQSLYEQAWNELRSGKLSPDLKSGMLFEGNNIKRGLVASLSTLSSIEDVEKITQNIAQDTGSVQFYKDAASAINRSLIPLSAEALFNPLTPEVKEFLNDTMYGPLSTITGDLTFEQMLASDKFTPAQKAHASLIAFENWIKFNSDAAKLRSSLDQKRKDLDTATVKAISEIPDRNDAEELAERLLAQVLDKIHAETINKSGAAADNEKIAAATEHLKDLQKLAKSTAAMRNALVGIAKLIPREVLSNPAEGAQILEELSAIVELSVAGVTNHSEWIKRLASELHRHEVGNNRSINAGADIIEATLHLLYQMGNSNQALLMVRLADDGTLKRFDSDLLAKIAAKTPIGYVTLLKKYAKSQVESDALQRASKAINRKVDRLTTQIEQMEQAEAVLAAVEKDPAHIAHGKAVQVANEGQYLDYKTDDLKGGGSIVHYKDPITGEDVEIQHGFNSTTELANVEKLKTLALHGFEYAAKPDVDPMRAAYWTEFGNRVNQNLRSDLHPQAPFKIPAFLDPMKLIGKWRFFLIGSDAFSKLPGQLPAKANRTLTAFGQVKKIGMEVVQSYAARIERANHLAVLSHPGMPLAQWYAEVMQPIHDSRQTHGQHELRTGKFIPAYGHKVTAEDMAAINLQTSFDHSMRRVAEKAMDFLAAAENPVRIKVGDNLRRLAKSRGPGTVSRGRASHNDVVRAWKEAAIDQRFIDEWKTAHPGEEFDFKNAAYQAIITPRLEAFLARDNNFGTLILGHVLESSPEYIFFGKGKFRHEYNQLGANAQDLIADGEMPGNLSELSTWIAERHNSRKENEEKQVSELEVRNEIIREVSSYMKRIEDDAVEPPNQTMTEMVLRENSFTQERGTKIAPGFFYNYGVLDSQHGMSGKLNEATVWYLLDHIRDAEAVLAALRSEEERLIKQLKSDYGGTGALAIVKQSRSIKKQRRTETAQLTLSEVQDSITRIGKHLNNMNDIKDRRNDFFGSDVADRIGMPMTSATVGGLLINPGTVILNLSGGIVMNIMNTAKVSPYGNASWIVMPFKILRSVMVEAVSAMTRLMTSQATRDNIVLKLAKDHSLVEGILDEFVYDYVERMRIDEAVKESGISDPYTWADMGRDMRNVWDGLLNPKNPRDVGGKGYVSAWLTALPQSMSYLFRKIGPRLFDNLINVSTFTEASNIEKRQAKRALETFNARYENDPKFKADYDAAGNDFNRFALAWRARGEQLTPYELLGGFNNELFQTLANSPLAALQFRKLFEANTDIELAMLRHWWNHKHGNTSTPFFKDAERISLIYTLAQDANMGTAGNNPSYFDGSRTRQRFSLLLKYPIRASTQISNLYIKTSKQRSSIAAWPAFLLFVMVAGAIGVIGLDISDDLKKLVFGTQNRQPRFANATTDEERAKIFLAAATQHMGVMGSVYNLLNDSARKNGFQNPILMVNVLQDMAKAGVKMYQTGDIAGPATDFITHYQPLARAVVHFSGIREGLEEQRNAVALLTAAAPKSMESLQRQPASDNLRATPLTPVYAAIVNDALKGNWEAAKANFEKAVAFKVGEGLDDNAARQAVQNSLQFRRPETTVFRKQLTDAERQQVYSRLTPEGLAEVQKVNQTFDLLKNLTGGTGSAGLARSSGGQPLARSSTFSGRRSTALRSRFGGSRRRPRLAFGSLQRRARRRTSLRSRIWA